MDIWKNLEQARYLAPFAPQAGSNFGFILAASARRVYAGQGSTEFTSLLNYHIGSLPDFGKVAQYSIVSQRKEFVHEIQSWVTRLNSSDTSVRQNAQGELNNIITNDLKGWEFHASPINATSYLVAKDFLYDEREKLIRLAASRTVTQYPNKLNKLSELFAYLSFCDAEGWVTDIGELSNLPPQLIKLYCEVMDTGSWRPNHLKVRASDPESWDYDYDVEGR